MSAKRGLGKGFDALIPTDLLDESFDPTASQDGQISELRNIRLNDIAPDPDQPRQSFDDAKLEELVASVTAHGVVQPIVVVAKSGGYQIVAGERRYRAAKKAGLEKIPALVRTLSDQHKLELSLIENLQRQDLSPIETATAYQKLRTQFSLSDEEIGARVGGRSASTINNTLRLLRLPDAVKTALATGEATEGQVRPLINVDPDVATQLIKKIVAEGWTARRVEAVVNALKRGDTSALSRSKQLPMPVKFEKNSQALSKKFATKVDIQPNKRGGGKIVLRFSNEDDFDRLSKLLG